MSGYLWKYYFEDNVDAFRQLLEVSSYNVRANTSKASPLAQGHALGSPGSLGTSPTLLSKLRRVVPSGTTSLTRADINSKDSLGLTILHYAASSPSPNAPNFALALLEHPLTDLYSQDLENGWTALHRAFYFGNVAIARLILERERRQLLGHGGHSSQARGLIKIKDKEGNGPFDLFALSIQDRLIHHEELEKDDAGSGNEAEDYDSKGGDDDDADDGFRKARVRPQINIGGDGVFTFGSNKNVTLGFGDEDDRQYPERINIRRPDHLLQRFHREHLEKNLNRRDGIHSSATDADYSAQLNALPITSLPTTVRATPLTILDVQMSKLHTAVLTTDPESNLYMCGHGPGGRLGTGSETTRFQFACIEGGALAGKRVVTVALGQNHSLALSSDGEMFSWGSNLHGQLGYSLPKSTVKDEEPIQSLPRQIFGILKKELIIGTAASRIHSVAHTSTSLYTWGKNEGQLGIIDSDARSLETQTTPRKIAASLFAANINSVTAHDKATVVLLENHDVWVFANYGYSKILFPLDGFANYFLKASFLTTKYEKTPNRIVKITAAGDSICALSSSGEIFTVVVKSDPAQDTGTSTTNPMKIRSSLSMPICVWSAKKKHMAARDVAVDQDGSIILTTEAGGVWRRSKRAKIKDATASGTGEYKPKDYKFARIPGLTRVYAVRASSHGAYAAIRRDPDVTRCQIEVADPTLWNDMSSLLVFYSLATKEEDSDEELPMPRFWRRPNHSDMLQRRALVSEDLENDIAQLSEIRSASENLLYDAKISSSTSDIVIPVHQFILAGRSKVLRDALSGLTADTPFSISDMLSMTKAADGRVTLQLLSVEFLTLFNLTLYLYTDTIVSFWQFARQYPKQAFRYRQVRVELMKVASRLELRQLEPAVRLQVSPRPIMNFDFELALKQPSFFDNGDVAIQLSDGEILVHSALLCQRCPFFEAMFNGRAGGMWLADRRGPSATIDVDLKHVSKSVFQLVLRHIYADSEEEIFNHITSDDYSDYFALDEMLDLAIEVMGVANELMLTRLSQICQKVVGRYVHVRNVCSLLNAIAPCSVTGFKNASLEYICLNLEAILQSGLLDELEEDLILELDQVVRDNQLDCLPVARSGRADALLIERYPELAERIDKGKRAKVDAIVLSNKFADNEGRSSHSFRSQSLEEISTTPMKSKSRRKSHRDVRADDDSPANSPMLKGKPSTEMFFAMDDEEAGNGGATSSTSQRVSQHQSPDLGAIPFSLSQSKLSIGSPSLDLDKSPTFTPTVHPSGRPWGAAPLASKKLDMKDIMAQTSSSMQSGISLALSSQGRQDDRPIRSSNAKMSQKERKRMQQNSKQQFSPDIAATTNSPTPDAAASPWSNPRKVSASQPDVPRRVSTPHLTMRQTIANPGPSSKMQTYDTPHTKRSVSGSIQPNTNMPQHPKPNPPTPSSSTQPVLTPHSIRHTPLPDRSSTAQPQASMLSILSQQQAEKDYINTPEKRSLQEIQQEQEFQAWWDAESKRVIQEEKDRARREKSNGARRGRPKVRGGKAKNVVPDSNVTQGETSAQAVAAKPSEKVVPKSARAKDGQSVRGGRGAHRGRGGGRHTDSDRAKVTKERARPITQQDHPQTPSRT
ncbi:hypothetical protein EJ05DRAFT_113896 [Pseudovirgaria hyperparasitica]|uniref:BTB domain-containing protein n=1 Tax=Pseudovirgaria hyperparasitica TaxID=470096 RepID=A0A6A6VZM8_9PEZI|nr:uncharacterized protein EJ05DRAFT_113896 [Pseudovirgaria hyperparasitica]KAF2755743.1 hypothetical protein EJ05DRAFT_113896 [Pseudovirgaria hyperparasitica]